MITEQDLQEAIAECQGQRNPTANTCIKLAAFYTIKNELFPAAPGYSYAAESPPLEVRELTPEVVGDYGGSDFLQAVKGKDAGAMWRLMDEIMDTLKMVNERAYNGFMRKIH